MSVFQPNQTYYAADFHCTGCDYKTTVFIQSDFSLFDTYYENRICNHCGLEKEYICDGSMIIRYDWPDADDSPWQIQCAVIAEGTGYCTDCRDEVPISDDWRKLIVGCSQCNGDMIARDGLSEQN